MKKYCTKCGHEFIAIGREVICPSCKQAAAEESKRAAVLRAKRASWTGESVPVRISGRASTVIREWAKLHNMNFAASLDDLLQRVADDEDVSNMWVARNWAHWEDVEPYKSRRMKQDAQEDKAASKPQDVTSKPQAAKVNKTVKAAKVTGKAASKE